MVEDYVYGYGILEGMMSLKVKFFGYLYEVWDVLGSWYSKNVFYK